MLCAVPGSCVGGPLERGSKQTKGNLRGSVPSTCSSPHDDDLTKLAL